MRFTCYAISSVFAAALVATLTLSSPAAAKVGLPNEADINNDLFVFALANEIRKKCDSISPRMFRALSFRNDLYSKAKARGYSTAEIDGYIDNKAEQNKMKARGNEYLKQYGASLNDPASLCRAGRAEIKKRSQIGALLRAK